ncbi:DSS1/SEM1 family-domain-containing protein [Papiliotrema laurentii]|uniref:26S proteasome complex subunit SEM1 n=1 Tax=Papiliotrema laurentii TaxID=5418 RepID=A0AAD9FTA1_PAPLA|nr:DSS1/SEM1 family-domain-containing protein [Papiliotrema laurentii]
MSNAPNPSNAKQPEAGPSSAPKVEEAAAKKKLPQLGALEDDDEFEEFPAQGEYGGNVLDALAKAGKAGDRLWEENWDDDDIEDDFTKQLRTAIATRNGGDEAMKE